MDSLIASSADSGAVTDPGPVLFHTADGIARLTINRPEKRNALSPEVVVKMARAWEEIAGDSNVRVVVLRGAGDRVFSSGGDLQRLIPLLTGARQPEDEWDEKVKADPRLLNKAMLRTSRFTVPVVAAVNGAALAGGTELVLAADLRIASQHSTFGLPEVTRGIVPAMGGLARLSRQVPYTFAARIALTGEQISAAEAFAMGLVTKVVPAGELDAEVERVVERMAANAPIAMRKAKEALLRCGGSPLPDALRIESECGAVVLSTDDAREGPRAFVEKRAPRFVGR